MPGKLAARLRKASRSSGSSKADVGAPSGIGGNGQRKIAIVARLLGGEPLDLVPGKRMSPSLG